MKNHKNDRSNKKIKNTLKQAISCASCMGIVLALLISGGCGTVQSGKEAVQPELSGSSSAVAENMDPLGRYEPEITVSMVHQNGDQTVKFKNGDTFENNVFTRAYKEMLGINVKYLWVASGDDEAQKTNLMIASGSLPDIFMLDSLSQYEQLVKADKIQDLTDTFEKYATAYTKSIYSGEFARELEAVKRGGKLYTIPWFNDYNAIISMIWIRSDWLNNLNLQIPKTGEELFKVAEAFTFNDPDKNGKNDTYGIPMDNSGIESAFWNVFHSYPGIWTKDSAGKLSYGMYGSKEQADATKAALLKLQEFYKKGVIRKDFTTIEDAQLSEDIISGKCGVLFGTASRPYFQLQDNTKTDAKADWIPLAIPSLNGTKQTISASPLNQYGFYVVRKGYEHPEALVKLLNLYNKLENDPSTVTQEYLDVYGSFFKAAPVRLYEPHTFFNDYNSLKSAIESGDTAKLTIIQKQYYENIKAFSDAGDKTFTNRGNKTGWADFKYYGPGGAAAVAETYNKNGLYVYDEYFGPPTKSFISKQPLIDKKWNQIMMDIITGADTAEFDSFVESYGAMGGDAIAGEVNEWFELNQKSN
ncbi:lipoprotein LipO precursor [Ruminiclostridium hungatei]|uniref:Lipoprotein LipO n=1 Tax=Ruminiclostridium hungatei TaxID=48256 RepID=A0A1V4SHM7_RUMHU|nr:extracellular solute-binding protein [Ruminiclostridium hungatei]OPX43380.1 lipoprotein LipO precursor [Ruminiclostridium hungatei]